ncbi:hypothetical protein Gotri_024055, partial [Gossypium trilobum]|nr:hypothetical protein [Gossypium trilobum]
IHGHSLEHFLDSSTLPPSKFTITEFGKFVPNEAYTLFVKQDYALALWLLSTMSPQYLVSTCWCKNRGLYLVHLDLTIFNYFHNQGDASPLQASLPPKSPISAIEHNSAILNGLPHDHDFFVAVITSSHEPYTFDRIASILMDAESGLQEPFRFPMSINTTQVTAPSLINIDSTLRLKLPTSSSSGFSSPFSSQAHFSGSVTLTHFVPRPRFLYLNRGRGRTTYYLQCQLCGNMRHLVDHYYYCFNQSFLGIQSSTPTKPTIVTLLQIFAYTVPVPQTMNSPHTLSPHLTGIIHLFNIPLLTQ